MFLYCAITYMFCFCQVLKAQNNWQIVNTNLSRYRSQSLYVLLDNAQGDTSQDPRTSKLRKREFKICLVRSIEEQARPIENCRHVLSAEFLFKPNYSLSPKRIKVSNLLLQVYKENPKHIFNKVFQREKSVSLLYLGFCTQKLFKVFYRCYSLKNLKIRYCKSCCIQDQRLRRSKTFEWSLKVTSVGACVANA